MALDFPASPTVGQVYTVGSLTYIWNGYAWEGGGSIALPSVAVVSDTPPASPVPGALWWESDSGLLFVNYADGTSTQWVQINSVRDEPPRDGNEYVRVNGVWRLIGQRVLLSGTQVDVAVPSWANILQMTGRVYHTAGTSVVALRFSGDGTTFLSGASDYFSGGAYHVTSGFGGGQPGPASYIDLTGGDDNTTVGHLFTTMLDVARPDNSIGFLVKGYSYGFHTSNGFTTSWYGGGLNAPGLLSQSRLAALRILAVSGPSFVAGSSVHFRWM
jgi:hypothetical protein